jgi:MYXO-CTERM domain-containing protein
VIRITLILVAVFLLLPSPADAGCPSASGCDMAKNVEASLSPEEACVDVRTENDSCSCDSWVSLENNCTVNLQAGDFTFDFCMIDSQVMYTGCPDIIPPGSWGAIYLPLNPEAELGHYEESLHLSVAGNNISLNLVYDVEHVESGCGCSTGDRSAGVLFAAGLLLILLARRRDR